jgi:hypothetical protein
MVRRQPGCRVASLVGLAGAARRRGCKLDGSTAKVGMACRGVAWLGQGALARRPAPLGQQRLGTGFIGQRWLVGRGGARQHAGAATRSWTAWHGARHYVAAWRLGDRVSAVGRHGTRGQSHARPQGTKVRSVGEGERRRGLTCVVGVLQRRTMWKGSPAL